MDGREFYAEEWLFCYKDIPDGPQVIPGLPIGCVGIVADTSGSAFARQLVAERLGRGTTNALTFEQGTTIYATDSGLSVSGVTSERIPPLHMLMGHHGYTQKLLENLIGHSDLTVLEITQRLEGTTLTLAQRAMGILHVLAKEKNTAVLVVGPEARKLFSCSAHYRAILEKSADGYAEMRAISPSFRSFAIQKSFRKIAGDRLVESKSARTAKFGGVYVEKRVDLT